MPEKIRMKIGRASYIQRVGEKDYLKTRSRIESVPMHKLAKLARMGSRTWRLFQEGNDLFLILEALTWEEEEKAAPTDKQP
jgi:IS4 transposase